MGVTVKKYKGKWYIFINYHGRRRSKCIGTSRQAAEEVRRQLEARLALGDLNIFEEKEQIPLFDDYSEKWIDQHARLHCKPSTVRGYKNILKEYLKPRFGTLPLDRISRDQIKAMLGELGDKGLSRNTLRNALCAIRVILNCALDDGLIGVNPACRLGKFTKTDTEAFKASALTRDESEKFLAAAQTHCPEYYGLFLAALRAGMRRGELVALKWGDIQFGTGPEDSNRYILVQRNFVHGEFTSPKSKKSRRVDLSQQLRQELHRLREERLLAAFLKGQESIAEELVFPGPQGGVLDPDNLIKRYFLPCLTAAELRRFRFHDLRHTFGSQLIQDGATLTYVKEQMGHHSIQVTVDTYGHLIPGADIAWVDRLDSKTDAKTSPQQSASQAQPVPEAEMEIPAELVDLIGGGGRTRTSDLRIMRPSL